MAIVQWSKDIHNAEKVFIFLKEQQLCVCVCAHERERNWKKKTKTKQTSSNFLFLVYEQIFATRMFIMLLKDWENCLFKNRFCILYTI